MFGSVTQEWAKLHPPQIYCRNIFILNFFQTSIQPPPKNGFSAPNGNSAWGDDVGGDPWRGRNSIRP